MVSMYRGKVGGTKRVLTAREMTSYQQRRAIDSREAVAGGKEPLRMPVGSVRESRDTDPNKSPHIFAEQPYDAYRRGIVLKTWLKAQEHYTELRLSSRNQVGILLFFKLGIRSSSTSS